MAILVDASGTQTWADGTSRTLASFVVGNHSDRVLYVGVACYIASPPQTISSVTFGGTGMTNIHEETTTNHRVSVWRLIAPSVSTADIVANASASIRMKVGAVSLYGVHQTTPNRTTQGANNTTGDPATVNVTSATGELVIDFCQAEYGYSSHGAGQTDLFNQNDDYGWMSSYESGASSVTMSENLTGSTASWRIVGISVQPADSTIISKPPPVNHLRPAIFTRGIAL